MALRLNVRARILVSLFAAAVTVALCAASPAVAYRGAAVGMYNVNNQAMRSGQYVYALRFVLDQDTTLARFISGFNLEGSDYVGGRSGYAKGDGGTIRARLVSVNADGTPNLNNVLAQETVNAVQRYQEAKVAYGAPALTQLLYVNTGGVMLRANTMYAMTYQNVAADPLSNWFSENSPTVKESVAGPNGVNTTDPNAPGAIDRLDPREAVGWSTNSGQTWAWGRHAGEGPAPGSYGGSASGDDGTRLPWYGWQSPGAAPASNQPFYAYMASGSYTIQSKPTPQATVLTSAGGYAPVGGAAGVIAVRNLATGVTGRTAPLGSGLAVGMLDQPVTIKVGERYEVSNTGTVLKQENDSFIESTFRVSLLSGSFVTIGNGNDRAELFALPDPWASSSAAPPPTTSAPPPTSPPPSAPTTSPPPPPMVRPVAASPAAAARPAVARPARRSSRKCARVSRRRGRPARRTAPACRAGKRRSRRASTRRRAQR